MRFRQFLEAFPFHGVPAIQTSGLFKKSTFGLEIEFIAADAPVDFNSIDQENEDAGDLDYYDIGEDLFGTQANIATRILAGYWIEETKALIKKFGFEAKTDKTAGATVWAVGPDGLSPDDDYAGDPVIEIRTAPMTMNDLPRFKEFLNELRSFLKTNQKYLKVGGLTGIHIHVSNPALKRLNGEIDSFSRLSAVIGVDEDKVWDDNAAYNRDFEQYARLQKGHYGDMSPYHDDIVGLFLNKMNIDLRDMHTSSKVFSTNDFDYILEKLGAAEWRNTGINSQTKHPTVEYRYLSTAILLESDGVEKILQYVNYFSQHAVSRANKNRIIIKHSAGHELILTRVPNGVQINFINAKSRVPQTKSLYRKANEKLTLPQPIPKYVSDDVKKADPNTYYPPITFNGRRIMGGIDRTRLNLLRRQG